MFWYQVLEHEPLLRRPAQAPEPAGESPMRWPGWASVRHSTVSGQDELQWGTRANPCKEFEAQWILCLKSDSVPQWWSTVCHSDDPQNCTCDDPHDCLLILNLTVCHGDDPQTSCEVQTNPKTWQIHCEVTRMSFSEALELLSFGATQRAVGATQMNKASSRSHCQGEYIYIYIYIYT